MRLFRRKIHHDRGNLPNPKINLLPERSRDGKYLGGPAIREADLIEEKRRETRMTEEYGSREKDDIERGYLGEALGDRRRRTRGEEVGEPREGRGPSYGARWGVLAGAAALGLAALFGIRGCTRPGIVGPRLVERGNTHTYQLRNWNPSIGTDYIEIESPGFLGVLKKHEIADVEGSPGKYYTNVEFSSAGKYKISWERETEKPKPETLAEATVRAFEPKVSAAIAKRKTKQVAPPRVEATKPEESVAPLEIRAYGIKGPTDVRVGKEFAILVEGWDPSNYDLRVKAPYMSDLLLVSVERAGNKYHARFTPKKSGEYRFYLKDRRKQGLFYWAAMDSLFVNAR